MERFTLILKPSNYQRWFTRIYCYLCVLSLLTLGVVYNISLMLCITLCILILAFLECKVINQTSTVNKIALSQDGQIKLIRGDDIEIGQLNRNCVVSDVFCLLRYQNADALHEHSIAHATGSRFSTIYHHFLSYWKRRFGVIIYTRHWLVFQDSIDEQHYRKLCRLILSRRHQHSK
ncbi:protein YgfX [Flocculibacter collagenilyticus]|uniref:protein YgfX n=1 Tax=Flocculibacter collagenilyticus TaxID=2744479 RepID=UPI002D8116D2|nr:protein YgfX [Flocculibacter collagenilyticus]